MTPLHRLLCVAAVGAPLAACQPAAAPEEPAPTPAEPPVVATPAGPPVTTTPTGPITYQCADGKTLVAAYTGDTASVTYDGETHAMTTVRSASGALYQGGGLQWWTRGLSEGRIAPLPAGQTEPAAGTDVLCTAPAAPAPTG